MNESAAETFSAAFFLFAQNSAAAQNSRYL